MFNVLIVGYGNIGRFALDAVSSANDANLVGIMRRGAKAGDKIQGYDVFSSLDEIKEKIDVALLCVPTSKVFEYAKYFSEHKINTVDCFDRHKDILSLREKLLEITKQNGTKAVISAGWDPGSDSVVRALLEAICPKGITNTNFGTGMSMGHSVVAKSVKGVRDALSITIPLGSSLHRRMVYVELEEGANFEEIEREILSNDSFSSDDSHVIETKCVKSLIDMGHGVLIERKGVSGKTHNQNISFKMSINNPAATSQIMLSCARALMKREPGVYTMIELPVVDMLEGSAEENIKRLV